MSKRFGPPRLRGSTQENSERRRRSSPRSPQEKSAGWKFCPPFPEVQQQYFPSRVGGDRNHGNVSLQPVVISRRSNQVRRLRPAKPLLSACWDNAVDISVADVANVKFAIGILAKTGWIVQRKVPNGGGEKLVRDVPKARDNRPVVTKDPDAAGPVSAKGAEVIPEDVIATQARDLATAIDIAPNDALPGGMRIIEDGIDRIGRGRVVRVSGVLDETFSHPPPVVEVAAGFRYGLNVNLFATTLADVADIHIAS